VHRAVFALTIFAAFTAGAGTAAPEKPAPPYSALRTADVVELRDARADIVVPVITTLSNAYASGDGLLN